MMRHAPASLPLLWSHVILSLRYLLVVCFIIARVYNLFEYQHHDYVACWHTADSSG